MKKFVHICVIHIKIVFHASFFVAMIFLSRAHKVSERQTPTQTINTPIKKQTNILQISLEIFVFSLCHLFLSIYAIWFGVALNNTFFLPELFSSCALAKHVYFAWYSKTDYKAKAEPQRFSLTSINVNEFSATCI